MTLLRENGVVIRAIAFKDHLEKSLGARAGLPAGEAGAQTDRSILGTISAYLSNIRCLAVI